MNAAISIHGVKSVTAQRKRLNGSWQLALVIRHDNGDETVVSLWGEGQLTLDKLPDEYVRIEDYSPRVERSEAPL